MINDMHRMFDQVKLILYRLNNMWSPSGQTFSHRAEYHLNNAVWNPLDTDHCIIQLHLADQHILAQYYIWNESCHDPATDSWNMIWGSCRETLDTLKQSLSKKNKSLI